MEIKLEESVNHRIAMLAVLLKRQVFRIIAEQELEITPDQWVILYYLWQENGLSVGEIVQKTQKDFANVTRIIDKLEKMGYVSKQKSQKDSRICHVYIQPQAEQIKDKIHACWAKSMEIALKDVSDTEQKLLVELLNKIENNILSYIE